MSALAVFGPSPNTLKQASGSTSSRSSHPSLCTPATLIHLPLTHIIWPLMLCAGSLWYRPLILTSTVLSNKAPITPERHNNISCTRPLSAKGLIALAGFNGIVKVKSPCGTMLG